MFKEAEHGITGLDQCHVLKIHTMDPLKQPNNS